MKTVEFMYASQIPSMKLIINDFESSIALRKNMEGPKNQVGICFGSKLPFAFQLSNRIMLVILYCICPNKCIDCE